MKKILLVFSLIINYANAQENFYYDYNDGEYRDEHYYEQNHDFFMNENEVTPQEDSSNDYIFNDERIFVHQSEFESSSGSM